MAFLNPWRAAPVATYEPKLPSVAVIADRAIANPRLYSPNALISAAAEVKDNPSLKERLVTAAETTANNPKVPTNTLPKEPDTTKYDLRQGAQKPADFIAVLKEKGASLTSVELNMPNDDVFQALVDYCPNITTLSYNTPGMNVGTDEPTNAGLLKVAQLTKLKSFRFCVDEMFQIDASGISALLSSSLFVNQIENLYISLFLLYVDDKVYPIFSTYKNLKEFYLNGNITKSETLENNPLPATLTKFYFVQYPYPGLFTDTFLSVLPGNLTHLTLSGSTWTKVTADGLSNMQARMLFLTQFAMGGEAVSSEQALAITTPLTSFTISDCSKLSTSDLVSITNNQPKLQSYSIGKAVNFNQLVPLPTPLKSLTLDAPKLYDFSAVPNTLEEFTLSHINLPYAYYTFSQFKSLRVLRIQRCLGFNDAAFIPLINAIKDKVQVLELNGVNITIKGAQELAKCSKLDTLILNQLYAFSADDLSTLLNLVSLRQRIVNLYIGKLAFNNDNLGPILSSFEKLQDLFLMLNGLNLPKDLKLRVQTVGSFWLGPSQFLKFFQLQK